MNRDRSFEDDLKEVLNDMANDPAPDDLVTRVHEIPRQGAGNAAARRSGSGRFWPAFGALAATVAVAAIIVVALEFRGPANVSGPGANATPPAGAVASPSVPPASVVPSSTPLGTPASTPQGPAGTAVPASFKPDSVTFVSRDLGWVLGTADCGGSSCLAIVRTTDAGATWSAIPAPASTLALAPYGNSGVSRIRFADPLDGWVFGPELWATHDGGATWTRLSIPGVTAGSPIAALETARGTVHAAIYDGSAVRVATSAIGSDSWRLSDATAMIGAGPVPSTQIVLQGDAGWLLQVDRTVVGGLRLVAGQWQAWQPPCAAVAGPAILAASSANDLVAACDVGLWSNPEGERLFVSHDGGASFGRLAPHLPITSVTGTAAADTRTIVVAGNGASSSASMSSGGSGSTLATSFDGGASWSTTVLSQAGLQLVDIGFTTPQQGVVIEAGVALLMTDDGGHTWREVTFAR